MHCFFAAARFLWRGAQYIVSTFRLSTVRVVGCLKYTRESDFRKSTEPIAYQ